MISMCVVILLSLYVVVITGRGRLVRCVRELGERVRQPRLSVRCCIRSMMSCVGLV